MTVRFLSPLAALGPLAFATVSVYAAPAAAQTGDSTSVTVFGALGAVSDYRDRGVSLSDQDISLVGSLTLEHDSGVYIGAHGGGVRVPGRLFGGADVRLSPYVGYLADVNGFTLDLSFELDGFEGGDEGRFFPEIKTSLSRDFGLFYTRAGLTYAFDGRWLNPETDSLYGYFDLEVPVPGLPALTLLTHVGYDLRDGRSDLVDWSAGLSWFVGDFELSAVWSDTSLDSPGADPGMPRGGRGDTLGEGNLSFGLRLYF